MESSIEQGKPDDHLCVLVHGLWGNPTHLEYVSLAIRGRYPHIRQLICKRNSGNFTYDGIETGGERVTKEIEIALDEYSRSGIKIKKLSVVGYSLGGLVSRYAIGLLYSRGWFEKLQPVNFTTFATPHLGVRTPLLGWHNHLWNVLGARVLSASGRQLFLIDKFRNTGRPLLSILADRDSVFYKGLSKFSNKVLYANIVNDRSTCFYTSGISINDPFADLSAISVNYVPGFEPVVLDSVDPLPSANTGDHLPIYHRVTLTTQAIARRLPRMLLYILFIPIVLVAFFLNALFQTFTSWRRIRMHETKEGEREGYHYYRTLPLMLVEEMQEAVEGVVEDIYQMQAPDHLPLRFEESDYFRKPKLRSVHSTPVLGASHRSIGLSTSSLLNSPKLCQPSKSASVAPLVGKKANCGTKPTVLSSDSEYEVNGTGSNQQTHSSTLRCGLLKPSITEHIPSTRYANLAGSMGFPTLALTQSQFEMIHNLNTLGFLKFPVWIHNDPHSHAAIIVRRPWKESWAEGKVVVRHWVEEMFIS